MGSGDLSDKPGVLGDVRGQVVELRPGRRPPGEGTKGLPEIKITTREREVIDQAISALGCHPAVYQRAGQLVHVVKENVETTSIVRPAGAPRIVPLPLPRLRELLSDSARWLKWKPAFRQRRGWDSEDNDDGDGKWVDAHPADWAVRGVEARGAWPGVRQLEAVIEAPTLRPDGTVLEEAGYDAATALLLLPSMTFPPVPKSPTREDAAAAVAQLLEVVVDFPLASPEHKAAWLSAVLTPLARFAFSGPTPLNLFDANVRSAGKSLLVDVTAEIVAGRPAARTSATDDDAEMRKRITSIAIAGDPIVLIDNVLGALGTPSLDAALTATNWSDRLLGTNVTPTWPLYATWYATGNNVVLNGDTTRRTLHVRLESPEEKPELRQDFVHPDVGAYVRARRPELVIAALTILRAYCAVGRPDQALPSWGSFEGWSRLVRHALVWAGAADPGSTREELQDEADRDAGALADLVAGWEVLVNQLGRPCTTAEALEEMDSVERWRYERLKAALAELCPTRGGGLPTAQRIGKTLTRFKGRVVKGRALVRGEKGINGCTWTVRATSVPRPERQPKSVSDTTQIELLGSETPRK